MAGEEVSKEISERRSRAGSNLNVNFNGGGVLLLLGAAAGTLLASAFAARRIRSNKRRRGSMTEGIQRDSCELSHEAKEFEGGAGDKANAGEGVVQVNSHENLDENVQISHVGQREIGFYLREEEKGDVAEGSPTIDIELVDGGRAKLTGCRDSSANNSSSPANASRTLGICSSLGENQLKYDDDELVANSVKEDRKISCIISKEDDGDDCKGDYKEEIEGKKASSLYSEQSSILEEKYSNHVQFVEAPELVEDDEEVERGDITRERRVQANTSTDLHGNLEILDIVKRESDIYLIKKVAERSPTKEIELVDRVEGKLACLKGSRAKIGSSPANVYNKLGIDISLEEDQLRYDDEQLVADRVREETKTPFIYRKEDDKDNKKAYKEEQGERKELEEKITHLNLHTEELCLSEANTSADLHENLKFFDFVKRESDIYLIEKVAERSLPKEIELVNGVEEKLACLSGLRAETGSSPTNVYNNLGIEISLEEDQLKYDDEQLVVDGAREETETPFIYRKEDDEDNKKAYIEEQGEKKELEEKITHINLHIEELCLFEKKTSQILDVGKSIERKFEDHFKDEMYNYILEFVLSRAKGMAASSSVGDQDEMNPLIEEIEPFFGGSGEAKVLDMTQNDSGKHTEMAIMEDEIIMESDGFKDAMRLNNLCVERDDGNGDTSDDKMVEGSIDFCEQTAVCVEQDNRNGDTSDDKMVEESIDLCEQFATFTHKSSVTTSSELETSNSKDSIMSMAKEDVQLIAHIDGIVLTEEDEVDVEESYYPSGDECVEGSIIEIQRTESCIHENPTMMMIVEEKIQLEDSATGVLTDVIQEEKIEEDLSNGFKENMKSSETAEDLRGNEEFHLIEFQRTEFPFEQDIMMAYRESPLIQFQGIEPIAREEKAFLEDNNLNNSEKNLEEEECQASNQELGTSLSDIEREAEIISVQHHELETKQYIEAHKYKLEREIEYPQTSPAVKKGVGEIHVEEDDEKQTLKLFLDLAEKTIKLLAKTIKHQCQVEGHENNASAKAEQQRRAIEKVKGMEHMFMGYFNGHIFLVTTLIIAFAILAFFV